MAGKREKGHRAGEKGVVLGRNGRGRSERRKGCGHGRPGEVGVVKWRRASYVVREGKGRTTKI